MTIARADGSLCSFWGPTTTITFATSWRQSFRGRVYAHAEAGRPITASLLSQEKGDILDGYWAGVVEIDDGAKLTWMRQPHYYSGLYSYTYSAGLTCATVVAQALSEEGSEAGERWIRVLREAA